jgi:Protein of unknown function (DUF4065)
VAGHAEVEFNQRRFKDLLLYVAKQLADDPTFGETKLNKVLFFSDFESYRLRGEPITGAVYQKNKYGPTARLYTVMRDELLRTGQARVERRLVVDHVQDVVIPLVEPNMRQFSVDEIALVDRFINELRRYTNLEVSDLSHERAAGWIAHELGEAIPYQTALISTEPVDDEVIAYFERLAPSAL